VEQQIGDLEQVFSAFGWEPGDSPYPAIECIHREAKAVGPAGAVRAALEAAESFPHANGG